MESSITSGAGDIMNILENFEASFSPAYILSSTILSIVVGVLLCAFVIVAAALTKKNLGFGIVTGILQIIGSFATQKYVHVFSQMDLVQLETFYGNSQSDVQNQVNEFYTEYLTSMLGDFVVILVCSIFILLSWVFGLIFIIKNMKLLPKAFPVIALIFHIIRYVAIPPADMITPLTQKVTDLTQQSYDMGYYLACAIPFLLVLIGAIVYRAKASKQSKTMEVEYDGENWSVKL